MHAPATRSVSRLHAKMIEKMPVYQWGSNTIRALRIKTIEGDGSAIRLTFVEDFPAYCVEGYWYWEELRRIGVGGFKDGGDLCYVINADLSESLMTADMLGQHWERAPEPPKMNGEQLEFLDAVARIKNTPAFRYVAAMLTDEEVNKMLPQLATPDFDEVQEADVTRAAIDDGVRSGLTIPDLPADERAHAESELNGPEYKALKEAKAKPATIDRLLDLISRDLEEEVYEHLADSQPETIDWTICVGGLGGLFNAICILFRDPRIDDLTCNLLSTSEFKAYTVDECRTLAKVRIKNAIEKLDGMLNPPVGDDFPRQPDALSRIATALESIAESAQKLANQPRVATYEKLRAEFDKAIGPRPFTPPPRTTYPGHASEQTPTANRDSLNK